MNTIGIIFAMKEELTETLKYVEIENEYELFDLHIYECVYKDKKCILVECGIGKVNAARCSQILIDNLDVDCIINVGVAGGVSKDVEICDIVIGNKLIQHDFDLRPFNYERGFIPKVGKYIDCDEYLIRIAEQIELSVKTHVGVIASGDIFVTDDNMAKKINDKFGALCVEMEGASIAQTCYLSNIPFIVIRSISDSPNKNADNNITFDEFLEKSSSIAACFTIKMLDNIL